MKTQQKRHWTGYYPPKCTNQCNEQPACFSHAGYVDGSNRAGSRLKCRFCNGYAYVMHPVPYPTDDWQQLLDQSVQDGVYDTH